MTIDFKGVFRNKNREQRKINDLERLESRRWVNRVLRGHYAYYGIAGNFRGLKKVYTLNGQVLGFFRKQLELHGH